MKRKHIEKLSKCSGCGKEVSNCMRMGIENEEGSFCIGCLEKKGIDINFLEENTFSIFDSCKKFGICKRSLNEIKNEIKRLRK